MPSHGLPARGGGGPRLAALVACLLSCGALLPVAGCGGASRAAKSPALPSSPLEGPQAAKPSTVTAAPGESAVTHRQRPAPPTQRPTLPAQEPLMRVRIDEQSREAVQLSHASGKVLVRALPGGEVREARSPVSVQRAKGAWTVTEGAGKPGAAQLQVPAGARVGIEAPAGSGGDLQWRGRAWPGIAEVVATGPDASDLVFVVPMETYLPGVISKELIKGWAPQTYRAQAVAARSFAACEHAWWDGRRHFDVNADQSSQAWVGTTSDATSLAAVQDTRGEYLVFDGRVVPAYFSSACGGAPANANDAILDGTWVDIGPLQVDSRGDARPKGCCEKAPTARWRSAISCADMSKRLNAWATQQGRKDLGGLGPVKSITLVESNAAGRPTAFRITDAAGHKAMWEAEDMRRALREGTKDLIKSSFVTVQVAGGRVLFEGRGHGHGVGLCQYGAEAMARAGRGYRDILLRYYPGASVQRAPTGPAPAQASMPAGKAR